MGKAELEDRHVLSVSQYERGQIDELFEVAQRCLPIARSERISDVLHGRVLANLFFEPSTRTRLSFETAFRRLGGAVESTVGIQFSSMAKGETLEDTVRVISGYVDAIVLRHPERGSVARAATVSLCPVVNGGDGPGEHPTQALLDTFTIREEVGQVDGVHLAMVGDLKYGRTVHSLARMLARYHNVTLTFVSPPSLQMPRSVLDILDARGVTWRVVDSLVEAARDADVLYVTRLQAERFSDPAEAARLAGSYTVDRAVLEDAGVAQRIVVMHPLPRYGDLSPDVDDLPGAAYFRQAHYGVPVRMALFCKIFDVLP